jgi:hypothetical protein
MEKETFDAPEVEIIRYDEEALIETVDISSGVSQPGHGGSF